jgi:hypothetical protein
MKTMKTLLSAILSIAFISSAFAEKFKFESSNKNGGSQGDITVANCTPATAATELDINNTRALIQSGGDMWWDFNRARYEIPKGSNKTSLFAGSLWLAGQDVSGQFKVAALRFRQVGNDYWTGPLSTINAEIDPNTCRLYDRHWETTRSMVAEFAAWFDAGEFDAENGTQTQSTLFPGYAVPSEISEWPAHGRNYSPYNEDYYLAPFYDRNGDGDYNVSDGDYPGYVLVGKSDCSRRVRDLYGDQNLWWVFNDKGNVHTESGGLSIGMEIRAQAFAFATTDEVNNMTFYNYELINRSTFELADTYFGQWVDPDLGNAQDDYVGCDVRRGLGYVYNGDDNDEDASGNLGYGVNPPALGIDFFQGPFQANDGVDNCLCVDDYAGAIAEDGIVYDGQGAGYGDGIVDNERYGMRKFLYHNNAPGPVGDPNIATDYYNMLRGIWKDGTPMTYGGNGYDPSNASAIPAGYMFPGETDPVFWGTDGVDPGIGAWSENSAGNLPGDRRFVQSSGPFRLGPGAVNNITVGLVWQQATSGGRLASVEAMRKADDKTQALFDTCFEILDGPDAPDVTVQELDREIILMLSNPQNSNNYKEDYFSTDPFLAAPDSVDINGDGSNDLALTDEEKELYGTYKFEGYQVYQLADGSVGTSDLEDNDKARLIAQVDVPNDIDKLINFEFDSQLDQDVPNLKVDGANEGIKHAFRVNEDAFATDDNRLINHKTYYFMVIAYAYNRFGDGFGNLQYIDGVYDPASNRLEGQKIPYLASRKSPAGPVRVYEPIPHLTSMEQGGIQLNSSFGDGVELKRIEGSGNGANYVNIKEDVVDSLISSATADGEWLIPQLEFEAGFGPVKVQVVDPLMIPQGNFTLAFRDSTSTKDFTKLTWVLYGDGIDTVKSEQSISQGSEQVIFELGLSVATEYGYPALSGKSVTNGYLGSEIGYADETDNWLSGISDQDQSQVFNWIKSGTFLSPSSSQDLTSDDHLNNFAATTSPDLEVFSFLDPEEYWENAINKTWAPFALASYDTAHPVPMFNGNVLGAERLLQAANLANTPSVNVYITSDKAKWTRCPVFEAGDEDILSDGPATRGELRKALSVDKNGRNQLDANVNENEATYNGLQTIGDNLSNMTADDIAYYQAITGETSSSGLSKFSVGMGWFPGYAINAETGERLNMAFSEDSWLKNENGADMLWNPTDKIVEELFGELRFGGKHMIYVFRNNIEDAATQDAQYLMPSYDGGTFSFQSLIDFDPSQGSTLIDANSAKFRKYAGVWRAGAWVGYPLLAQDAKLFGESGNNDVVIKLRSTRPYVPYAAHDILEDPASLVVGETYYVYSGSLTTDVSLPSGDTTVVANTSVKKGQTFVAASSGYTSNSIVKLVQTINSGLPMYTFNTNDIAPTLDPKIAVEALDIIGVVPNPYYAYSQYETGRLDYRIKIINLPQTCTINIFTVNGTLVRSFSKDDPTVSSVDWNLKNQDNIPIAGGIYLIHVEVPGVGSTVIKWFGVLRPIDLNSF